MKHHLDAVHKIVETSMRLLGASVASMAMVGKGFPDLLVGYNGHNILLELKTGNGKLRPAQRKWLAEWRGQAWVVAIPHDATVDEVLSLCRSLLKGGAEGKTRV